MCVKSEITRAAKITQHRDVRSGTKPCLVLGLICVLLCTHSIASASQRLIVRFSGTHDVNNHTPTEQELRAISAVSQSGIKFIRSGSGGNQIIELDKELTPAQIEQITAKIAQLEIVTFVALDRRYRAQFVPDDPEFSRQWYLSNEQGGINAVEAWDYTTGSSNTVIAVLDTGILPHSDFVGRYLQGYDFISDLFTANDGDGRDSNPADPGDALTANDCEIGDPLIDKPSSWHGTAITGLIAANTDNAIGIAGIDHQVKILPVRVLGKCGGYSSDIVDAIRWAAGISDPALPSVNPNPANIINLSFGGIGDCTAAEQAAIDEVTAAGVLVIAGAGNGHMDVAGFAPANCDNVLTVAASTRQGGETCYTNFGVGIDISAPGGNTDGINNCSGGAADAIYTTSNSGVLGSAGESYASYTGTSFAAPMASATAALLRSINPGLTPAEIQTLLESSAREFPTGTGDSYGDCDTTRCGHGLLDAYAAVLATRADALNMQGTGIIQMSRVEDCVLEDTPSIDVAIDRVSGSGSVAANVVTKRISAIAGEDFGAIDQLVVWPGDDMETKYLTIPIYEDNRIEGAEYFSVEIAALSPNADFGYPASTRITIISTDGNTIKTCAQPTTPPTPAPDPPSTNGGGSMSLVFLCIQILLFSLNNNRVLRRNR